MPYLSQAQQGWAHSPAGMKALGGASKVAEWDAASKGHKDLPKHVSKRKGIARGMNPNKKQKLCKIYKR